MAIVKYILYLSSSIVNKMKNLILLSLSVFIRIAILLTMILLFFSCTKESVAQPTTNFKKNKYQVVVDLYKKDYSKLLHRELFYQDYLMKEDSYGMDTIPEQLYKVCIGDTTIENIYYLVNDKRTLGTKVEVRLTPEKIDTNWINYHKN